MSALAASAALVLSGCGSGDDRTATPTPSGPTRSEAAPTAPAGTPTAPATTDASPTAGSSGAAGSGAAGGSSAGGSSAGSSTGDDNKGDDGGSGSGGTQDGGGTGAGKAPSGSIDGTWTGTTQGRLVALTVESGKAALIADSHVCEGDLTDKDKALRLTCTDGDTGRTKGTVVSRSAKTLVIDWGGVRDTLHRSVVAATPAPAA